MEEYKLGPNGSMIFCIEFLQANIHWLIDKIRALHREKGIKYFLFDLPGQVEIYSNNAALREIIQTLEKKLPMRVAALHLVDCSYLYDRNRFLSALTLSLTATVGMDMPMINAISKVDLLKTLGRPDMGLSFYQNMSGLNLMFHDCQEDEASPFMKKYGKLSQELCDLVERYNMVSYSMIDIHNKMSMCNIVMQLDQANGYFYDPQKLKNPKETEIDYERLKDYMEHDALMDIEEQYFESHDDNEED